MEELIQKAKNGDKEAFTTIMLSLENIKKRYCLKI